MSTKSLVITTRIPLSGDLVEEAKTVTMAGVHAAAFKEALTNEFGAEGFELTIGAATKRAPQSTNGTGRPPGRQRRSAAPSPDAGTPAQA